MFVRERSRLRNFGRKQSPRIGLRAKSCAHLMNSANRAMNFTVGFVHRSRVGASKAKHFVLSADIERRHRARRKSPGMNTCEEHELTIFRMNTCQKREGVG